MWMNYVLITLVVLSEFLEIVQSTNGINFFDLQNQDNCFCSANLTIHGLILAREGSKGISYKNLAQIQGKSLLARTIEKMIALKKFSSVWVSTDGIKIAKESIKFGAKVHWRNKETATDTATSLEALQEFINAHQDGMITPLNFNPSHRPRRQDWGGELVENGMFYFTSKKFIKNGLIQGGRIGIVEIPKYANLEIDTSEDLRLAQVLSNLFDI